MDPSKINERVWKLWEQHFNHNPEVLAPVLYDEIKENAFVFIGCNPSFFPNKMKGYLKKHDEELGKTDLNEFLKWVKCKNNYDKLKSLSIKIDRIMRTD